MVTGEGKSLSVTGGGNLSVMEGGNPCRSWEGIPIGHGRRESLSITGGGNPYQSWEERIATNAEQFKRKLKTFYMQK